MCSAEIIWQFQWMNKHLGRTAVSITKCGGWGSHTPNLLPMFLKFLKKETNVNLTFQNQVAWKILVFIS